MRRRSPATAGRVRQLGSGATLEASGRPLAPRTAPKPARVSLEPTSAPERILGLDLAMGLTGWCMLLDGRPGAHGTFALPSRRKDEPLADWLGRRAEELARQVRLLRVLHEPEVVAFEYPDTYRRSWSGGTKGREFEVSLALGRVQGFLVARWPEIGGDARLVAVSTSDAKRTVTGRVDASKDQVRMHLALDYRWDIAGWSDDESDAGAVALAAADPVLG